jgi:protease I
MSRILIPLPRRDFDPTEAGVPWLELTRRGHELIFATPDGKPASADPHMLSGQGLGIWRPLLMADRRGRSAHDAMAASSTFAHPLPYAELRANDFDALLLPGGHAAGMREYLESPELQTLIVSAFESSLKIAAICHGVVLVSRAHLSCGKSVLFERRTTALTRRLELTAWTMTRLWLGDYYRTYPTTVEDEVTATLARPGDFATGPLALLRDSPDHLERGFTVRDGNFLSARWPGDAHRFAHDFAAMVEA